MIISQSFNILRKVVKNFYTWYINSLLNFDKLAIGRCKLLLFLWYDLNSLLTLHFPNRTKMEGYAIHSKSCLHFQQDEEHVCADNRVWKTSGWLFGGTYQGQKHESGWLQDRKRQVLSYHNIFSNCCSHPSLTCLHSHVHTKHTHSTVPLSPFTSSHVILMALKRVFLHPAFKLPHFTSPIGKSYAVFFLNCPISQFPLI